MKLMVISSPVFFKEEAGLINQLFAAGLQHLHLRKENAERKDYLRLIQAIDPVYHDRIALHQFHELAAETGISRLHFPEHQRIISRESLPVLYKHFTLSTSVHNIDQITDLKYFKYTFYGPVFNSISKKGYLSGCQEGFKVPAPGALEVIALGGIDEGKISQLKEMDFNGAALLGCLWTRKDQAVNTFIKIQEQCQ